MRKGARRSGNPARREAERLYSENVLGSALDHPCVGAPNGPESYLYPLNMLRRILLTEDEVGNPVEETLSSIFANPFDEDDEDDGEELNPTGGWG
ncbi:hypothetical protein ABZ547_16960 [Streptomyces sparsogenes]|uniref:hypothetical protein n=1 Tax=Streptomyces sparsogenes TaxID=67365 RepID=UPI003404A285